MTTPGPTHLHAFRNLIRSLAAGCFAVACLNAPTLCSAAVAVIDPLSTDPFFYSYVPATGSVEITTTNPRSGQASLELSKGSGANNSYIGHRAEYVPFGTWGSLSMLSFDSYTDPASAVSISAAVALRVYKFGEPNTFFLRYSEPVLTGEWRTINALPNMVIEQDGAAIPPASLDEIPPDAPIYQVSIRSNYSNGSPWHGFADNLTLGFDGNEPITYNFEPVPEPSSLALAALAAMTLLRRPRAGCARTGHSVSP